MVAVAIHSVRSMRGVERRSADGTEKQGYISFPPGPRVVLDPLLLENAQSQDSVFEDADGRHSSYLVGTCTCSLRTLSSSELSLQVPSFI